MIYKIENKEQAEQILRSVAAVKPIYSCIIFDIDTSIKDAKEIPLILRRCHKKCQTPGEYLGWNIWGYGPARDSTYCPCCGWSMETESEVQIAIQGSQVIQTGYRYTDG